MAAPEWTAEKVSALDIDKIKNLMSNALKANRADIVSTCETELLSRMKNGKPVIRVSQFHFVCDPARNLTENGNGTFWSGYWDVDKGHFANSVAFNTAIALHKPDKDGSFLQGKITRWEENAEGQVRFLAKNTEAQMDWVGEGDGVNGYKWIAVR
jgi:hypothetical protein